MTPVKRGCKLCELQVFYGLYAVTLGTRAPKNLTLAKASYFFHVPMFVASMDQLSR